MSILIENEGCLVYVNYDYHAITLAEIEAYKTAGRPQPDAIYRAWDARNRALLSSSGQQPYFIRFEVTGTDDEAELVYQFDDLIDSTILGVSIEGQGINESDDQQVSINTSTGNVVFGVGLTKGQFIKIDYKK